MHDAPEFLRPREYHREGAAVRLWRFLRRNTHVTIPLLVPWLMLAAGQALAHRHYSRVTEYVAAVAACAVMWFAADRKWDTGPRLPRKRPVEKRWRWTSEVAYARASVIGASGWLLLAARYGPLTRPLEWALGAFCAAWGWLYWQHKRPRGKRARKRHAAEVARWDAWWQSHAHAFGAPGSAVLDAVTTEAVDSLLIQLVKGRQSYDTLKGQARLIESALDGHVHYGMIRLERVKENGSQVWLHLKREDPLREEIGLDESMLPDDITQAVPLGVRESGGWFTAVLRRGWFIIGKTRRGKALALDTPIATPDGWKVMGELAAGDVVFDETGTQCNVTDAWDVRHGRPCYELTFSDGSVIIADAEHQWLPSIALDRAAGSGRRNPAKRAQKTDIRRPRASRSLAPKVITTETMAQLVRTPAGRANYAIPVAGALQCAGAELPLPPYTLGAWLGDGASRTGSITTPDPEVLAEIEKEGGEVWLVPSTIKPGCASYRVRGLTTSLHHMGLLMNKHIPVEYLRASEAQRRALLAGLLDTDGYCTARRGCAQYTSTSERLARDVLHLAITLGYRATLTSKPARLNGKDCGTAWTVAFTPADKVFRLPRKAARLIVGEERHRFLGQRYVTSIRPVPSVPVRCIAVDSPSHLFLAGESCIPTHNSNQLSVMFAAITRCRNARLWLIDMKGGRSMRPWLATVDWPAVTIGEARLVLGCAVAEERARGTYAYGGTEQLEPTEDVPALFAAIDETHGVTSETAGDAQCAASLAIVAGEGSGLEVYPVVSTQYGALAESVRTNQTRMNLDGRMCFQVDDPEDGTFALGDDARNSADPTKLREKGQFFCRLNAETSPEQIRGPLIEHDQVRLIAARNAWTTRLHERPLVLYCGNQPCPLMPGRTWQQVYDERWSRLPAAFHADAPQAVTVNPSPAAESQVPTKISNSYPPEVTEQVARINDEVDELPVTSADIERARQLRAARGAEPVSLQCEFDERRRKFAALLDAAPPEGIAPRMLEQGSGFSREWVRRLLNALVDGNAVEKAGPGRYRPLMPAWEALEILRESNDKLAAEARQMAGV